MSDQYEKWPKIVTSKSDPHHIMLVFCQTSVGEQDLLYVYKYLQNQLSWFGRPCRLMLGVSTAEMTGQEFQRMTGWVEELSWVQDKERENTNGETELHTTMNMHIYGKADYNTVN